MRLTIWSIFCWTLSTMLCIICGIHKYFVLQFVSETKLLCWFYVVFINLILIVERNLMYLLFCCTCPLRVALCLTWLFLCENVCTKSPTRSRRRNNKALEHMDMLKWFARKCFCKDISHMLLGVDVRNIHLLLCVFFADKIVFGFNMLSSFVIFRVLDLD